MLNSFSEGNFIFGPIDQRFSTTGTRPCTGTFRPSYHCIPGLEIFLKIHCKQNSPRNKTSTDEFKAKKTEIEAKPTSTSYW